MTQILTPHRQELLLERVEPLVNELKNVDVFHARSRSGDKPAQNGLPKSALAPAVSYLGRHLDLERLHGFLSRIESLDQLIDQNQTHPKAQQAAVKQVLVPWLKEAQDLNAQEVLFVLAWARRLLPNKQELSAIQRPNAAGPRDSRKPQGNPRQGSSRRRPPRSSGPLGGNHFAKLYDHKDKKTE